MDEVSSHQLRQDLVVADHPSAPVPPTLDPDEHREMLAAFELTKEQENELLQTLWNIMSAMVDLGWGLDSVHLFSNQAAGNVDTDSSTALKKNSVHPFNSIAALARKDNDQNDQ
ncbi:Uncharacterised protein [Halioglobus japonicus]|nr:Uncharacterised protein [Halioglobus japonicus]